MVNIIDLISQKIELFRLEQRYTKRRNRRSTFVSEAIYVDGEYIYSSPSPTLSKRHSVQQFHSGSQESMSTTTDEGSSSRSSPRATKFDTAATEGADGVGELEKQVKPKRAWNSARMLKRRSMLTVQEVKWEESS